MLRIFLFFTILFFISTGALSAQVRNKASDEKLIAALIDSENIRGVFGDDGIYVFINLPEIQQILKLQAKALPLLISHLDDTRLLNLQTNYSGKGENTRVTVGAACYDLLTLIIRQDATLFDKRCLREQEEGAAGSCARQDFIIVPEDFWQGKTLRASRRILRAKRNWLNAYRKNKIRYKGIK